MKYRVNLFPPELEPKLDLFTLNFVMVLWLITGLVVAAATHYSQQVLTETQTATKKIQQEHANRKTLFDTLKTARDTRAQNPVLLAEQKDLNSEQRAKSLLLNELQGREQLKNQGFSVLMRDLSEQHIAEIWLTQISIEEARVRIEGGSLDSSKVPFWVSQLRQSEYFSGRDFAGARMYRNEEDELTFVLSSDLQGLTSADDNVITEVRRGVQQGVTQ